MKPRFLALDEVLVIHRIQVERYGGTLGVRDEHALMSAIEMPQMGAFGEYYHSDVFEMAAAYLFHIVLNHPFLDGNKRTGFFAAYEFLGLNGYELEIDEGVAYDLVIGVAQGLVAKREVADALREHTAKLGG